MRCTNCRTEFEVDDWVFTDGVSECLCGECIMDIACDLPARELARMLGYGEERYEGDEEEEEQEKPKAPEQIPGQMDIWGGSQDDGPEGD